jgi:hypothetical protein
MTEAQRLYRTLPKSRFQMRVGIGRALEVNDADPLKALSNAMMFKTTRVISLMMLLTTLVVGCGPRETSPVRDEPTTMEVPTIHGAMSATINGNDWSAGGTPVDTKLDDVTAMRDPNTGMVTIDGRRYQYHAFKATDMEEISITLKQLEPGVYQLAPDFNHFQTATYSRGLQDPTVYFIHEAQTGEARITRIDTAAHRVFGEFRFECRNAKGDLVRIEDGTFDNVKYD